MSWLDRLWEAWRRRGTEPVAGGHPPGDSRPPTGAPPSEETIEWGQEVPPAQPMASEPPPGEPET
jgi:hypothetical protein